MALVVWDFHGVGCLEFPSPSFLLLLIFVFDPTAGRCIVMALMIVTDGCRFGYVNRLLRYGMQGHQKKLLLYLQGRCYSPFFLGASFSRPLGARSPVLK